MSYAIFLVALLPVVTGQLADILGGTECENLFEAMRDAMESRTSDFYGPQDFFVALGLSTNKTKQLKKFACKLPDVKSIPQLAGITPHGESKSVGRKYLQMIAKLNHDAGGPQKVIKTFKLYVTIYEEGKFLPIDLNVLPWRGDRNDALIFFSKLAREFGDDFPTFLMQQVSSFKREFFNMTSVPEFVDSLFEDDNIDEAAANLGISPRLLDAFFRVMYFATNEDLSVIQLYKRTYVLMERLVDIGFFELSLL